MRKSDFFRLTTYCYTDTYGETSTFQPVTDRPAEPNRLGPDGPTDGPAEPAARRTVTVERTYLALDALAQLKPAPLPRHPVLLERLDPCPEEAWRRLYREIGGPWHWHDRDVWDSVRIQNHLARAEVSVYRLTVEFGTGPLANAGFLELERHGDGSTEIVYFGIDHRCFGLGIGGWMLTEAVRIAFADGANRVWLHTCTLDGPAALPNYRQRGFQIERTETYQATLSS